MKLIIEIKDPFGITTVVTLTKPFLEDPSSVEKFLKVLEDHRFLSVFDLFLRFTRNISDEDLVCFLDLKKHPNIKRLDERHFILSSHA